MGGSVSKLMGKIFGTKEMRLLMLGLDAAGKTTILYKLKENKEVQTIPTVGFNVETIMYRNTKFNVWDVGGQDKIRPLWRHYFTNTNAVIFVVDSADRDPGRIQAAKDSLASVMGNSEMSGCLLLVFANKQDLREAMSPDEIVDKLQIKTTVQKQIWKVEPSCAKTGEGIFEGLAWLSENVKLPNQK